MTCNSNYTVPNTVIKASDIAIGYPRQRNRDKETLYDNLSFNLFSGELTCLLGVNGAGKSTLLRTMAGIQTPLVGQVDLLEKDIAKYTEHELSKTIGLVLTDKTSAGGLTVYELVSLGRYPYTGFFGKLTKEDRVIIENAIADVGITHKMTAYVAELSDGERQKAMVAKTLAQESRVILLDEPTAFLDITSRIDIMNLLHQLAVEQNKSILLSTHDIELALMLADRMWMLSPTYGLHTGVTEDIIFSDTISRFLGNDTLSFDKKTGSFMPKTRGGKEVKLIADETMKRWVNNLLLRNGYIESSYSELEIQIHSATDITLKKNGQEKNLKTFEELVQFLKKNKC